MPLTIRPTPPTVAPARTDAFGAAPASRGPTLLEEAGAVAASVGHFVNGAPASLARTIKDGLDMGEVSRARALSDAQLAAMPEDQRVELASALLNPNLLERLVSRDDRSAQFLRVVTAKGSDAASMDRILVRVPGGAEAAAKLTGPARARFEALRASDAARPGDYQGLDRYLDAATASHLSPGTTVEPLIDGKTAFPAMLDAIDHATRSVDVATYAFHSDDAGWDYAKHLAAAVERGVKVRVLFDPLGSSFTDGKPTDPALNRWMSAHGIEVREHHEDSVGRGTLHRKITVVDGTTAFTGGMNVGVDYRDRWHDVQARITGAGAGELMKLFAEEWRADGGTVQPGEAGSVAAEGGASARVIGHDGLHDRNQKLAYLRAIDTARSEIRIANPYFVDADVAAHLAAAARRGVACTVMLPSRSDHKMVEYAQKSHYQELLGAGVKILEYHGAPMAHEKLATFDGKLSVIGSSNLDAASLSNNDEDDVWSSDPTVAAKLNRDLFDVDAKASNPVTKYQPGAFGKLADGLSRLVSDWI